MIRRNSDRDDFRLIWIRGNHDGPADIISHIVGVEILDEYVFDNGQIQLLILHGDQFDTFITEYKLLTEVACGIFYCIQKWAPHRAARWIRRITKRWQRNSQLVQQRAIEYARSQGLSVRDLRPHPPPPDRRGRRGPILQHAGPGSSTPPARSSRSSATRSGSRPSRPRASSRAAEAVEDAAEPPPSRPSAEALIATLGTGPKCG